MVAAAQAAGAEDVALRRTAVPSARPRQHEQHDDRGAARRRSTRASRIRQSQASMLSYFPDASAAARSRTLPYRAPGSPGQSRQQFLSGKPIRYYRPKGSPEVRHLIDDGFQAFNAGPAVRGVPDLLREDAGARERHDDRADDRRRDDAGRSRRLRDRDDGPRARRLHHLDRREPLSRPALRAELHAASRLAVRRTTSSCTRTASSASTTCCFRRRCCSKPTPTSATSSSAPG